MLPNGPIAALAGTRMTMPYGMSALGADLDSCFIEQSATLGELVLAAKQRAVHFGFEKEQAANGSNGKDYITRDSTPENA